MTPEQLKASILQCAIQGKLVEQRPEEGTAEELYKRIKDEKQKLIKKGTIKKEKPLAEITEDEIPFDIPDSWTWVRFGECGVLKSGYAFKSSEYSNSGIQVVRISDLAENEVSNTDAVYYPQNDALEPYLITENSFLICLTGSIGKMAWVKDKTPRYLNQRVGMFEPLLSCDTSYLWWFLHNRYVLNQWIGAKTSTNGNIKNANITDLICPLPPLDEQHRIVTKIEELLPYVDRYAEAYEKLEQFNAKFPEDMKKSILQYAIQGKLVEQRPEEGTAEELYQQIQDEKQRLIKEGKIKKEKPLAEITEDETPFDIPESWKWVRLPEVGELARGKSKHRPRNDNCLYEGGGYPFIQTGDVAQTDFKISKWTTEYNEKGLAQSRLWEKGTLCLTIAANIGDVAILDFDACFPDSVVGFNAYKPICDNKFFLYGLMCYKAILDKMSHSTAQKNINLDILSNVAFPLPPIKEQMRIVDKIEELLPYCDRLVK